jgi:hypothetical protein
VVTSAPVGLAASTAVAASTTPAVANGKDKKVSVSDTIYASSNALWWN